MGEPPFSVPLIRDRSTSSSRRFCLSGNDSLVRGMGGWRELFLELHNSHLVVDKVGGGGCISPSNPGVCCVFVGWDIVLVVAWGSGFVFGGDEMIPSFVLKFPYIENLRSGRVF